MRLLPLPRPAMAGLLALALAGGCAPEPTSPEPDALSGIRITANTAGTPIATLVVEVSAADFATNLVFNLVVDETTGIASGTVRVPHGLARTFHITAFDDTGEITHEGQATIDVRPGQNPPLQITLGPRSGHVPLTVSFGSFSVIVTPSSAVLTIGGETVQLTAQVIDEEGTFLPAGTPVQWATTNPGLVTVDANGLVTAAGVAGAAFAGEALIVATYEGVAGFSSINPGGGSTEDADGDGYTVVAGDCDDTNADVHPGAVEILDGLDNDCDGAVDGESEDADADGYTVAAGDCDDTRGDVNPDAVEILDGVDNDCDGQVDEGFELVITEVQAIPYTGTADWSEWIEVWNASDLELNPNGLLLEVNGEHCRVSATQPVPQHSYFTINFGPFTGGSSKFECRDEVGQPLTGIPDGTLTIWMGLGMVVEGGAVFDPVMDQVTFLDNAVAGTPRSLNPIATDQLSNDDPSNWCLASPGGTPGQGNLDCF